MIRDAIIVICALLMLGVCWAIATAGPVVPLLTPCGPATTLRHDAPGCPCPARSHVHVDGSGTVPR